MSKRTLYRKKTSAELFAHLGGEHGGLVTLEPEEYLPDDSSFTVVGQFVEQAWCDTHDLPLPYGLSLCRGRAWIDPCVASVRLVQQP
jgi:hypothetical protein